MPHQCVRCNKFFEDGSQQIIKGCPCGAKLFFYIKKQQLDQSSKDILTNFTQEEKQQIEHDVKEILHVKEELDNPVVLDLESIRIIQPGKYELDLVHLFKKDPLIIKLDEGKYMIDLPQAFKKQNDINEMP